MRKSSKIKSLIGVLLFAGSLLLAVNGEKVIEVRGHFNYPPYEYFDETGNPIGFDVDIIREVARLMDLNINIELGTWEDVATALETGSIDVLMGVYYTPERDKIYDFSIPYETVTYSLFVRKDSPISRLDDLPGKSIVLVSGGISTDFVAAQNLSLKINQVNSANDALRLLSAGMYDCTIIPKNMGQFAIDHNGFTNVKAVGPLLLPRNLGFAVSEGNEELLVKLNKGIRLIKNSNQFERLHQKWLDVYDESQIATRHAVQLVIWIGAVLILLFILSVAGIATLKRQVEEKTRHLQEEIKERKRIEEALQQSKQIQEVLYKIANASRGAKSLNELYHTIKIIISAIIDTSNFYIALIDEKESQITFPFFVDERDPQPGPISLESGLTGHLLKLKKPLFFTKKDIKRLRSDHEIQLIGVPSELWLGAPLKIGEKVIGAVVVQSYDNPSLYSEKDLDVLEFVSNEIADAIHSKLVNDAIKKSEEKYRLLSACLTEANSMKALLLDVITHDLRNPAGVVYGMSEMLLEEDTGNEELQLINESCRNLLNVIDNATLLSKVTLGDEISKNNLNLNDIIQSTANDYHSILVDAEMTFEFEQKESVYVKANPIISEVFKNYISNAIKYSFEGKKIRAEIVNDGKYITINYIDYGPTIPPEKRPLIFDRGVQLETGAKRGGRGLGLAIVKRIAEAHDGKVGVRPNKPSGNIFYLQIPV